MPVAETFTFADETGKALSDVAELDTMVTVVDAFNFISDYQEAEELKPKFCICLSHFQQGSARRLLAVFENRRLNDGLVFLAAV